MKIFLGLRSSYILYQITSLSNNVLSQMMLIVTLCTTPHFYGNVSCRSFHSTEFPTAHCSNQNVVLVSACGEKSKICSIRHFPINTGMYVNLSIFWESIDAHQYYSGQKKRPLEAGNVGGGIHKTQIHKTVIICFSSITKTQIN